MRIRWITPGDIFMWNAVMQQRFIGTVIKTYLLGDWIWFDVVFLRISWGVLHIVIFFFLWHIPPASATQKSTATGTTTSKRSVPISWATLIPAAGSAKANLFSINVTQGTGALVDDGSSERFLLRIIKISYHKNHPRIFK